MAVKLKKMPDGKFVPAKMPSKIGDLIDLGWAIKMERMVLENEAAKLKQAENFMKNFLLKSFGKEKIGQSVGTKGKANLHPKSIPQAKDWRKVQAWIKKTGRFDIMQRRLNEKAVNDTFEAKQTIPGIEFFKMTAISFTPLKGKSKRGAAVGAD